MTSCSTNFPHVVNWNAKFCVQSFTNKKNRLSKLGNLYFATCGFATRWWSIQSPCTPWLRIGSVLYISINQKTKDIWLLLWLWFWGPTYEQFWKSCKFNDVLLIGIKTYIQFLLYKHNPWQHDQNWIVSVNIIFFRMVKSLQSMQAKTYTKGDLCRGLLSNLIFLGTPSILRKSLLPSWLVSYHKKSISISGLI